MENGTLGARMKQYEAEAWKYDGDRSGRPVILRLDGHRFHKWTRQMKLARPFDQDYIKIVQETTKYLCESISTCVMGYCQSDEISLCLRNDQSGNSEPWFGNRVQKMVSVSASKAAAFFNRLVFMRYSGTVRPADAPGTGHPEKDPAEELRRQMDEMALGSSLRIDPIPLAEFDSRALFLPDLDEVVNYFIWRQGDCVSNSLSSLSQCVFSHQELKGKNAERQKEMLESKKLSWDGLPCHWRMGSFIHKRETEVWHEGVSFKRMKFFVDTSVPKFSESKGFVKGAYLFSTLMK